jgi:hypothetical protein
VKNHCALMLAACRFSRLRTPVRNRQIVIVRGWSKRLSLAAREAWHLTNFREWFAQAWFIGKKFAFFQKKNPTASP